MNDNDEQLKVSVNSIIQVEVPSFEEKIINKKPETVYLLVFKNLYNKTRWKLEKTYQDFLTLNTLLTKLIPKIPYFGKYNSIFKSSKDYNTIMQRKTEIYNFLTQCVERKDIISNKSFINFVELDKNFPELIYNSPDFIEVIKKDQMTITDIIYLEKENILFSIFSDMEFTSRMDSYVKSGDLLSFKKDDSSLLDMGVNEKNIENAQKNKTGGFSVQKLNVYKNKKGELKVKLEDIFIKYFIEMTSSFYYDEEKHFFILGLFSGKVLFYKIAPDSNFTQFDFLEELKYHQSQVTGLATNPKNNTLFSCDDSGHFYFGVLDMIHKKNYYPELINQSAKGYKKLFYEKDKERLYLSSINGHLEVYLTSSASPLFMVDIETNLSLNYSLNDLFLYDIKHYLFSCSDNGNVSVFDLGKSGQEKTTKELSFFNYYNAKFRMLTILYDPDKNEVITGDDNGRIIFWNLKYGKPTHVTRVSRKKCSVVKIGFVHNPEGKNKLLYASCMDNCIYFIKLPISWLNNDEVEQYEKIEIKSRSDLEAMMKLQELLDKNEDYNSDEDSLNGWDYFALDAVEERKNKKDNNS